jgi:putative tryptophan/tyrosine transport system substrate-binding protein
MRRRDFIKVISGLAITWPHAARAQQRTLPAIGFLDSRSPEAVVSRLRAFRQGLQETGYVEGENVAIVYRFAENQLERLSDLAKDLVERRVAVIVTPGEPSAFAAKAATTTIPVVFGIADDPVKVGLVASLARPGGNITGINFLAAELTAKRLELLRQLLPQADRIAVLVNPAEPGRTESTIVVFDLLRYADQHSDPLFFVLRSRLRYGPSTLAANRVMRISRNSGGSARIIRWRPGIS